MRELLYNVRDIAISLLSIPTCRTSGSFIDPLTVDVDIVLNYKTFASLFFRWYVFELNLPKLCFGMPNFWRLLSQ